jgi:hypothetical protein
MTSSADSGVYSFRTFSLAGGLYGVLEILRIDLGQ